MARIRKVTKINRGINVCNEECTEKRMEKSMVDVNLLNSKKLCNNDRNRRILLTLKSYPNLFQSNYFSNNLLSSLRKYSVSTSTQTFEMDSLKTSTYAQTINWETKREKTDENTKNSVKQSKSDSSLLKRWDRNDQKSLFVRTIELIQKDKGNLPKEYESKDADKKIIILHKNEHLDPQIVSKKKERIISKKREKFEQRSYQRSHLKKKFNTQKVKRKSRNYSTLEMNEAYTSSYHKVIEKMGKFSVTTIAKWSSKLFKIFSDFGVSLTESLTNLYKYYESQKCQSLETVCNCQEFHQKIDYLVTKMNSLETNLNISQARLNEQQQKIDNTDHLERQIEEMKRKLESHDSLRSELADLRKQLNGSRATPPAPPLPPPPPPLPLFSLSTNCSSKTFLKVVQSEKKLSSFENPRPMITLEDILNVKLKKISVTNM